MYLAFDLLFDDRDTAQDFALKELASKGELVCVSFSHVPKGKCNKCGGLLFDFQREDDLRVGEPGDMISCFLDSCYGVVCDTCASKIALIPVQEI